MLKSIRIYKSYNNIFIILFSLAAQGFIKVATSVSADPFWIDDDDDDDDDYYYYYYYYYYYIIIIIIIIIKSESENYVINNNSIQKKMFKYLKM